ncbi:MAG: prepilin-type N-terminal cleavage/methylation domain-containing protein [Geminicoccaceae bacterium]
MFPDVDHKAKGFTLLEVLIALIIFAIAFAALAGIFQTSLRQAAISDELREATVLAEAQLARFGKDLPLEPGRTEGISADGLLWAAEVSLALPVDADSGIALYRISIEAGAGAASSRRVELRTLRIGSGR